MRKRHLGKNKNDESDSLQTKGNVGIMLEAIYVHICEYIIVLMHVQTSSL